MGVGWRDMIAWWAGRNKRKDLFANKLVKMTEDF